MVGLLIKQKLFKVTHICILNVTFNYKYTCVHICQLLQVAMKLLLKMLKVVWESHIKIARE